MESTRYIAREVANLSVFDESGNLVSYMDSLVDSFLDLNEGAFGVLVVRDALLNKQMLEFVSRKEAKSITDYDSFLMNNKQKDTFVLSGNKKSRKCRLIAKTWYFNHESEKEEIVMYEIPEAELVSNFKIFNNGYQTSEFDYVFEIIPFNEDGDTVKIHFEN